MKNKEEKGSLQPFRDMLKPNWQKLDFDKTDRGKKLPKPVVCKQYYRGEVFDLDNDISDLSKKSLFDIVHTRRSLRKYGSGDMSKKEFSYLVSLTCDIINYGPGYAFGVIPSGGASSTLETYFYLNHVEAFPRGLYHYMKDENRLRLIRTDILPEKINDVTSNQLRDAQVVVFWTATPYRSEYKYSFTAHKMIAMEAGHACQNLYLASEAIGYGAVAIAAYHQEFADKLFDIGNEEFVIYIATVGKK